MADEPQFIPCPHGEERGRCAECAIERLRVPDPADGPQSISPEVTIIRLAYELGELRAKLVAVAEASRARAAELHQMNERLRAQQTHTQQEGTDEP